MKEQQKPLRMAGILAHPTSFPSPYGIGDFGSGTYEFLDFLAAAGQKLWQVLPLGHTGYGDSPYQSFSAFAGQPLLVSPEKLLEQGLLTEEDLKDTPEFSQDKVDYGPVITWKTALFHIACERFRKSSSQNQKEDFQAFCSREADWLEDYALFMAAKDARKGRSFLEWPASDRRLTPELRKNWSADLAEGIYYYKFIQFLFFQQWNEVRSYAAAKGILIVGDIPIFVSMDSADVWAQPHLFQLDSKGFPTAVAGVPPDYFSEDGQLWGNPLYNWAAHKKEGYQWWIKRISHQLKQVDYLRIDHFRGFEAYCSIPYGETTARKGKWVKGPDADLFRAIRSALGDSLPIWAEDLGVITPEVEKLRDDFGFPGMKVLQFGFENEDDSSMLPHNFTTANCICYTGTHDNDTALGWYLSMDEGLQDRVRRYMNTDARMIHLDFIRTALGSVARYAVYPIQDVLGYGSDCRMNTPSVPSGNWQFRFRKDALSPGLAQYLKEMAVLYGRFSPDNSPEPEED